MSLLAVAVLMSMSTSTRAQDEQPVAVVSVASYDELMADLNFAGKLAEQPDLATNLEGMLKLFTQGQGLNGLNKKLPWGVAVTTDGMQFTPVAFLPVTDLNKLLTSLSGIVGEAGKPNAAGVIEITTPQGMPVYVKSQSGWAFIGNSEDALARVPADPLKLLGELPKSYDIAIRGYVQNVPEMYRELALSQIRQGVQMSLDRLPDEEDEAYAQRKKLVESQIGQIERIFTEVDTLTIGWQINQQEGTTHLDFNLNAIADTRLARQIEQAKNTKTNFSGFVLPGAAITANVTSEISKEDMEEALLQLDTLRARAEAEVEKDSNLPNDEAKEAVKDVLNDFMDVLVATIKAGKIDSGVAVLLEPKATKLIGGATIADGKQFDAALKKLVALAENEPDFPGVKFNAETHKNIRFHRMTVPVPDPEAHRVLGEELDVHVGVADKAIFLAIGSGSMEAVKKAIDSSASGAKAVPPFKASIALGKILEFAAALEENPMVSMMAAELEKSKGQDHITITAQAAGTSLTYRVEAETGVLKVLGTASRMAGGAGGGF